MSSGGVEAMWSFSVSKYRNGTSETTDQTVVEAEILARGSQRYSSRFSNSESYSAGRCEFVLVHEDLLVSDVSDSDSLSPRACGPRAVLNPHFRAPLMHTSFLGEYLRCHLVWEKLAMIFDVAAAHVQDA